MIKKPTNYDEIPSGEGPIKRLRDGYYEGIIKKAETRQIEGKDGKKYEVLSIALDIAEGDFKGYYQERFDSNTNPKKKWGLVQDIFLETESNTEEQNQKNAKRLKDFITSVEKSNEGYTFDWDEKTLKGKKVGLAFGLREFETSGSKVIMTTPELRFFRSIPAIKEIDYEDPRNKLRVRLIDGAFVEYNDYMKNKMKSQDEDNGDYITIEDTDDIPF